MGGVAETVTSEEQFPQLFLALGLLGILNVLDITTTAAVLQQGGREVNPIAAFFIAYGVLPVVKMGTWAGLVLLCYFRQQSRSLLRCVWTCVAAYVVVVGNNVYNLFS